MLKARSLDNIHYQRNNELEFIRTHKTDRPQLLAGIVDMKLREIGHLQTKAEILE